MPIADLLVVWAKVDSGVYLRNKRRRGASQDSERNKPDRPHLLYIPKIPYMVFLSKERLA